ncbi:MAG TPA: hypothetical protein VE152_07090 [Acidimicrobiales bacterium]|nr:hypothetical protein [Acidimicrobiales bacterium]
MTDRVVVLRPEQPRRFLEDVCGALAGAVNEPHAWRASDPELVDVYTEAVLALARMRREDVAALSGRRVQVAVIDHLIERVRQTRAGEFGVRLADVVDRLHAEAVSEVAGL